MRLLISALSVVFFVSFTPASKAADIGDSNSGNVKDTGHLLKNLASEQSKKITTEINELGPCKAWAGTLTSTCKEFKKGGSKVIGPPITLEKIYFLSTVVKKSEENDQSTDQKSNLPSQ